MGVQSKSGFTRDELKKLVKDTIESAIDDKVAQQLKPLKEKSTNWWDQLHGKAPALITGRNDPSKSGFGRIVKALVVGKGDPDQAVRFARKAWGQDDHITKSLMAGNATSGGFLVPDDLSSELIDALRPFSVVRQMQPDIVELPHGAKEFPRMDTTSSANWIGEGDVIPESEPTFGRVRLSAKKLAGLVSVSNDLINFSDVDAEQVVFDDLAKVLGTSENQALLRGDGLSNQHVGLVNHAGNSTTAGALSVSETTTRLYAALGFLENNDVPKRRMGWIMHPRSANALASLRTAGNDNFAWPTTHEDPMRLLKMPVGTSTNMPINLGGGSDSEIILADFSEVLLGQHAAIEIQIAREGAYSSGGNVVSAFERDESLVRAILRVDLAVRHEESVAVIDGVDWTAS